MSSPSTEWKIITSYEEAAEVIAKVGILPLSGLFPEHPSLESITQREAWHTGKDTDPWLWRDRFAGEGAAAYGRFMAKKPILVDAAWFPLLQAALKPAKSLRNRYEDGIVSKEVLRLYDLIEGHDGIDVKELRRAAGLQDKESKKTFDDALIELQSTGGIVIAGISERLNELGNKNGWNSTCYSLSGHWMARHGLEPLRIERQAAKDKLLARFREAASEAAAAKLAKLLR
jgi:hypothetical protein